MSGLNKQDIDILSHYAERGNRELYWNYLAHKPGNDGYGVLALGVVRNDNMPGAVANHFADAEAKRAGVHLTERGWNRFGVDLMERDLAVRADYLQRGRSDLALNLPAKDVMRVHDDAFTQAKIPVNAWTPREYLQAAHRQGEREAGPHATAAQRQTGGDREMNSAWNGMLNNIRLGVDRGATTMWGTSYQYNDEQLRAFDYTKRMGTAYALASVDRANTDPNVIGAKTVYNERQANGRWMFISEGPEYGPAFMSPNEMRSEHLERNPQRLRELEDTHRLRLEIQQLRKEFHPRDTEHKHDIKQSPRTIAEAEGLGEGVQLAAAARAPHALAPSGPVQLDDPGHPNRAMFAALLNVVHERDEQSGRARDQTSLQLAGGLTEKARERGLDAIGFAQFTPDGTKVAMTNTPDPNAPWARTAVGQVGELVGQSLPQSSENVAKINQQLAMAQTAPSPAQTLTNTQDLAPKALSIS
jgi:hypothetical protein